MVSIKKGVKSQDSFRRIGRQTSKYLTISAGKDWEN